MFERKVTCRSYEAPVSPCRRYDVNEQFRGSRIVISTCSSCKDVIDACVGDKRWHLHPMSEVFSVCTYEPIPISFSGVVGVAYSMVCRYFYIRSHWWLAKWSIAHQPCTLRVR
jgi:hypothetical protein